jgi:hypothetical protein
MASTESHADHSKTIDALGLPGQMPRKLNITMIGAGSFFTNSVLKDIILIPGHQGGELRLIDVDATTRSSMKQISAIFGQSVAAHNDAICSLAPITSSTPSK